MLCCSNGERRSLHCCKIKVSQFPDRLASRAVAPRLSDCHEQVRGTDEQAGMSFRDDVPEKTYTKVRFAGTNTAEKDHAGAGLQVVFKILSVLHDRFFGSLLPRLISPNVRYKQIV